MPPSHKKPKNGSTAPISVIIETNLPKANSELTSEHNVQKRYLIIVQHEITIYAENEEAAKRSLLRNEFMKSRTNLQCVYIAELPLTEPSIVFEDYRKAPGA